MKYHLIIYGCQMNKSDAERLATVLEKNGYQPTDKIKKANLICLIACSVRQMAIDRIYGTIKNIKKENRKVKIVLTGCLTKKDKELLKKQVDLVFDIKQLANLPKISSLIDANLKSQKLSDYLKIKPKYSSYPIAYVPIMTGCNNFCSYCVVPYTRGREISRPADEILREVKNLIKKKYKMIVLLGQNVNSYKSNLGFAKLLEKIARLSGNFWLSFITSHPKDLSTGLINVMGKEEKIMSYLHLPVQSGDDQILKKMNRHYKIAQYKKIIKQARKKIKNLNISTDIIVGFCGETKKQFNNTDKLMSWAKYDMVYLAKYSPRSGTAAEKFKDDISAQEKEKRWKTLATILKKTALENNKKYINQTIKVLITEDKGNYLFGHTKNFKNIKVTNNLTTAGSRRGGNQLSIINNHLVGQFVKVKITKTIPWGLEGIIEK